MMLVQYTLEEGGKIYTEELKADQASWRLAKIVVGLGAIRIVGEPEILDFAVRKYCDEMQIPEIKRMDGMQWDRCLPVWC